MAPFKLFQSLISIHTAITEFLFDAYKHFLALFEGFLSKIIVPVFQIDFLQFELFLLSQMCSLHLKIPLVSIFGQTVRLSLGQFVADLKAFFLGRPKVLVVS